MDKYQIIKNRIINNINKIQYNRIIYKLLTIINIKYKMYSQISNIYYNIYYNIIKIIKKYKIEYNKTPNTNNKYHKINSY